MKTARTKIVGRPSFTLIELLVVIAIIGVLISLLLAAVLKVVAKMDEVKAANDISQLSNAIEAFKVKFGSYPPSRIVLCEHMNDYYSNAPTNTAFFSQLHQDSFQFLNQCWPRLNWGTASSNNLIDWNGNGVLDTQVLLEGDQCLVFFLGGIPNALAGGVPGVLGFSTDVTNPANTTADRIGPFYDFDSNRLLSNLISLRPSFVAGATTFPNNGQSTATLATHPGPYFSLQDAYAKNIPYAYLSSYKGNNGYNRYFTNSSLGMDPTVISTSDCVTLGVWPYAKVLPNFYTSTTNPLSNAQYYKRDSFQLICAGRDATFGPGAVPPAGPFPPAATTISPIWLPDIADTYVKNPGPPVTFPNAKDDQSNFYIQLLGTRNTN